MVLLLGSATHRPSRLPKEMHQPPTLTDWECNKSACMSTNLVNSCVLLLQRMSPPSPPTALAERVVAAVAACRSALTDPALFVGALASGGVVLSCVCVVFDTVWCMGF